MKKRNIAFLLIFAMIMASLAGCGDNKESQSTGNKKLNIIATGFPEYDLTRAVVGDKADLKMLLKPGAESHSYEPTPEDLVNIQKSDIFVYGGGESDTWVKDILNSYDNDKQKVLALMDMVEVFEEEEVEGMSHDHDHHHDKDDHDKDHDRHDDKDDMHDDHDEHHDHDSDKHDKHDDNDKHDNHDDHDKDDMHDDHDKHKDDEHHDHDGEGEYDEHVWTSPENAIKIVRAVEKSVSEADPSNKDYYKSNADKYIKQLKQLDSEFENIVENGKRETLIFGDRFPLRYFVEEYDLKYFAAFPGCSAQTEPSAATLTFLINKVKTEKVPVVLKIELSNGNIAKAISDATGAKVLTFNTCHNVTQQQFKDGITYIDLMNENLKVLKEALN